MGSARKIRPQELAKCLEEGMTDSEIARMYGMSRQGVFAARRRLKAQLAGSIAQRHAGDVVRRKLRAVDIVHRNLERIERQQKQHDAELQRLWRLRIHQLETVDKGEQVDMDLVRDTTIALNAWQHAQRQYMAEARQQVHTAAAVFHVLQNAEELDRFQSAIMSVIEAHPELKVEVQDALSQFGCAAEVFETSAGG